MAGLFSSVKAGFGLHLVRDTALFQTEADAPVPEQKLDLEGPGYQFDAKSGTGRPGFKGRHVLIEDKCTGCQLCAIACETG